MPKNLRQQLDVAAAKNKRNVSQELLARLNSSFSGTRDKGYDRAARAFCFLILELEEQIAGEWNQSQRIVWHQHPFLFTAFKLAVGKLLEHFTPPGAVDSKSLNVDTRVDALAKKFEGTPLEEQERAFANKLKEVWKSPERVADQAFQQTLRALYVGIPTPAEMNTNWQIKQTQDYLSTLVGEEAKDSYFTNIKRRHENIFYGMADVRRDLQLTPPPAKTLTQDISPPYGYYTDPAAELIYERPPVEFTK
jgi:hypothetical protein